MSQEIRIPDIGDAEDVEVVEIIAASGDEVGEDDPIIVIESDKASMEVPAGVTGTIDEVTVSVGDKVSEGHVIARLKEGAAGEAGEAGEKDEEAPEEKGVAGEEDRGREAAPIQEAAPTHEPASTQEAAATSEAAPTSEAASTSEGGEEVVVSVPDIGEAENVEVIEVAVKAGDHVDENDMLVVVESDKASMEIPSTHAGTVKDVHVGVGTQVEEGTRLVTLMTTAGAASEEGSEEASEERSEEASEVGAASRPRSDRGQGAAPPSEENRGREAAPTKDRAAPTAHTPPSSGSSVYAGPAVRRLARELGVDLRQVEGTGNRGRIVKDDVKSHVKSRMAGGAAPAGGGTAGWPTMPEVDFSRFGEIEIQPLSRVRARGAENLHRAWVNAPHVTQHDEVDVTDLEDFRATLKVESERRGVKVTPLAFIIKACCQALKEFPTVNASLDPAAKNFILKRYYHIGMAVDTPDGLVVPVIRDADRKGIWELSAEAAELAEKAREKKLGMNDAQGGSFSVSSLGAIGGTGFTPIINAPEVAILGVGRLTIRPVWRDETFVPRKMLPLSLSYDHRAINGAEAGRFVARLGELLTDIRRLAL